MEKKRKRASFSPTIPDVPSKKREEKEEPPVLQQVVEVVVEEKPKRPEPLDVVDEIDPEESVRIKEPSPSIDADQLREQLKEELRRELKEELKREMHAEKKKYEKEEEEEVEVIASSEPEEEESEEEVVEEDGEIQEPKKEDSVQTNEETQQKERVAELFGKNSEALMPEITVHKSSTTRGLVMWAVTMVAIAVGVGGGLVIFTNRSNQTPGAPVVSNPTGSVSQPNPTSGAVVPTAIPTVKPTATVEKDTLKVQVQNGGGVVGAGSKMKSFLEEKGYTVTDVGNASNYSYEETEIIVKESKAEIRDILEEDLSSSYTVGKIETTLPESSPVDVRVIVGKK